jgi:hypothetical protein
MKNMTVVKIDAELIINICENSSVTIQPVTPTEISKLVATLKKKKAEDVDNLSAGHLQYGGSTISDYLASTINNIFYTKYVPDSIKKGLLTAVHKKDKDLSNPSNYRGITVISIICKLIEMCIRARIEGTLEKQQNKLQKGFTNIALLITESINGAKENNETLILITLDTEKAFDVVDHTHLCWKIYHQDITGLDRV